MRARASPPNTTSFAAILRLLETLNEIELLMRRSAHGQLLNQ
jgi:hypothetical protein